MKKCLKIHLDASLSAPIISEVQKKGSKLGIEGTIENLPDKNELHIVICGNKEEVDEFLDSLHKITARVKVINIAIEPFVKTKDYRGAFRVIHE